MLMPVETNSQKATARRAVAFALHAVRQPGILNPI